MSLIFFCTVWAVAHETDLIDHIATLKGAWEAGGCVGGERFGELMHLCRYQQHHPSVDG